MLLDYIKNKKEKRIQELKDQQSHMLKQCIIPKNFDYFVIRYQNQDWFDLEGFTNYVINSNRPELIYRFAKNVKASDAEKLQNALYKHSIIHSSYTRLSGIENSKHRYYGVPSWIKYNLKFAKNIATANKELALSNFENAIWKVSKNIFDDQGIYNKKTTGVKIFRSYLHDEWLDAIVDYSKLEGFDTKKIEQYLQHSATYPKEMLCDFAIRVKSADVPAIYKHFINMNELELAQKLYKTRLDYRKELSKINDNISTM